MYADKGSIIVVSHASNLRKRISVPDMRERLAAVAIYGLEDKRDRAEDRDARNDALRLTQAIQSVIRDAEEQGDVTQDKVLRELCAEMRTNKKYTMLPKALK